MKKCDLQPTTDNIRKTFINDSIGRNKDLVNFIKIIDSIEESYSISLDSYWGSGKTFFVKQVKMILDAINEFSYDSVNNDNKIEVKNKWKSLLDGDKINTNYHIPIYYDAWANDNDNDPILSIIYQVIKTVGNDTSIREGKGLCDICKLAGDIFELFKGFNPMEIAKKLKSDNPLESIIQAKSLQDRINEFIESLIPEHGERLLIIIDELDRCNPEFAVKLLERIKHYFNNDRVTFIFSVNLAELQHTIKRYYGVDFNAGRYLDRFFDLPIKLSPPDIDRYLELQGICKCNYVFDNSMKLIIKRYNLQLREIVKYIALSKAIVADQAYKDSYHMRNCRNVIIQVMIPVVTVLIITDNKKYTDFIDGNDSSPLIKFYDNNESIHNVIHYLSFIFPENEKNVFYNAEAIMQSLTYFQRLLNQFYNALLKGTGQTIIGNCTIMENDRIYFKNIISLLSNNTMKFINEEETIGV